VKKEEEDNDRVIQRFLDDPSFDPNVRRYTDGKTPLMCALDTRKCAFAEKIVKRPDIKVNLVDNDNRSALHYSVKIRGCDHVTELLLKHSDINTDIKDDDRSEHEATALHAALKANNSTAVALFKKYKKVPKAMKSLV
jgi:ankyrin repeat protein